MNFNGRLSTSNLAALPGAYKSATSSVPHYGFVVAIEVLGLLRSEDAQMNLKDRVKSFLYLPAAEGKLFDIFEPSMLAPR